MQIRIGYDLSFEVPQPTPMQLMLYVHPDQAPALRRPEWIVVEPATAVEGFLDSFGNRAARILAPAASCGSATTTSSTIAGATTSRSKACP